MLGGEGVWARSYGLKAALQKGGEVKDGLNGGETEIKAGRMASVSVVITLTVHPA